MLLIHLERQPAHGRIEWNCVDISAQVRRLEVDADLEGGLTVVRLTLIDNVTIVGDAGVLEFVKRPKVTP